MTKGIKSFGTKIAIGDGASPEVFTTISEAFKIPPIGGTKGSIDFSNHDSVGFKEFQMEDLAEGLELAVQCNMIPDDDTQELVVTAWDNSTVDNWRITLRGGKTRIFPAVVLHVDDDPSELQGRTVFNFTLKISGDIVRG